MRGVRKDVCLAKEVGEGLETSEVLLRCLSEEARESPMIRNALFDLQTLKAVLEGSQA